ncbi:uncharacterized protein DS421_16g552880 [Arachis hypogaea]|nr:uncharacterized protein DS421_16g552880 [Arachis hypogaea]
MARQAGNDGDINRLNETSHYAGAADFERPRLLLPWRVSHTRLPPDAIVSYLAEARFGDMVPLRDFTFDNFLISALVERWCPETHTFHLPWEEVVWHGDVGHGGAAAWCQASGGGTEGYAEEGVIHAEAGLVTQVQQPGSRTVATASSGLRRIYQRFSQWCPPDRGVYQYPLAARLVGLQQQSRDQHQARVLYWRVSIDRLRFDERMVTDVVHLLSISYRSNEKHK